MNIDVLNGGFVRLIEAWGHGDAGVAEAGIIEAARQSTQGSFRGWESDAKLLKYLYENKHSTPFEFAGMVIEVNAPIMVFREWHRHRTQSYNEMSARYAPLPDRNYVPTKERVLLGLGSGNKQAAGIVPLDESSVGPWLESLERFYIEAEKLYQWGLLGGIPKELARLVLPMGRFSQMRACANLRNWLAFLTLRMDPAAQWEIREYANAVGQIIEQRFPQTWRLFRAE